jgi:hypothetical protein
MRTDSSGKASTSDEPGGTFRYDGRRPPLGEPCTQTHGSRPSPAYCLAGRRSTLRPRPRPHPGVRQQRQSILRLMSSSFPSPSCQGEDFRSRSGSPTHAPSAVAARQGPTRKHAPAPQAGMPRGAGRCAHLENYFAFAHLDSSNTAITAELSRTCASWGSSKLAETGGPVWSHGLSGCGAAGRLARGLVNARTRASRFVLIGRFTTGWLAQSSCAASDQMCGRARIIAAVIATAARYSSSVNPRKRTRTRERRR